MFEVKIGDKVMERGSGRIGILKDIRLVPNGINYPELIAILYVWCEEQDRMIESTSENWTAIGSETYSEFYPSVRLGQLSDEILIRPYRRIKSIL